MKGNSWLSGEQKSNQLHICLCYLARSCRYIITLKYYCSWEWYQPLYLIFLLNGPLLPYFAFKSLLWLFRYVAVFGWSPAPLSSVKVGTCVHQRELRLVKRDKHVWVPCLWARGLTLMLRMWKIDWTSSLGRSQRLQRRCAHTLCVNVTIYLHRHITVTLLQRAWVN